MRIGVLGTGDVGQTLAAGFASLGHDVKMGSRDAGSDKVRAFVESATKRGGTASGGTFADAAKHGELVVVSTAWSGTQHALTLAGADNFAGKVVIDTTNPLVMQPGKPPTLALGHTDSAGEQVQRWLPAARVVKAFNIVGYALMVKPDLPGGPPDMFIAGDDMAAKSTVTQLLTDFGWPTTDLGGIEAARMLEPVCLLWVTYSMRTGARDHAIKMLKR